LSDELFVRDEEREAIRLADVLQAMEDGAPAPISALEDPELTSLVQTTELLRRSIADSTDTASFHSYRARSRAYVLHTLEQQHRPAAPDRKVVPFIRRRWTILAPVAAAAAVASFAFFGTHASAPITNEGSPAAANLTAASTDAELARIEQAIAQLSDRAQRGEPVDANLLRTITETSAAVASRIDATPGLVSRDHVTSYQKAVTAGTTVLTTLTPTADNETALAAAQRATQDGVVAAARYLGTTATATATTTATATATTTATATPTATATATATIQPTQTTPMGSPDAPEDARVTP
jgi:hypothetical protein